MCVYVCGSLCIGQRVSVLLVIEPRVGKAGGGKLEENVRSQRKCRCIYSVLVGIAAVVADIT